VRAALLSDEGLSVRDWPAPIPGAGEAAVEVSVAGVCGSDVHFAIDGGARTAFRPIILGHETAGRVSLLGPETEGPPVGTRVAIVPIVSCRRCSQCLSGRTVLCPKREVLGTDRHGSWSDLVVVPAINLLPIPDSLTDAQAAVATDAVATAYHAVATRGRVGPGMSVAVWGVGGLGLCAVAIARRLGAGTIIAVDPRTDARARASQAGAHTAVTPDDASEQIRAVGGVDAAFEFVGTTETVELAARSLAPGGRAVVVGMGRGRASAGPLVTFVAQEREVVGSLGSEPQEIATVLEMLGGGRLEVPDLVGDVIALADVRDGLERLHAGATGGGRIVIDIAGDRSC
jgi:threonine dehydrogenase-like Zn-dependent dehydrogenase